MTAYLIYCTAYLITDLSTQFKTIDYSNQIVVKIQIRLKHLLLENQNVSKSENAGH